MIFCLRNLPLFAFLIVVIAGCHLAGGKKKDLSFAVNGDFESQTLSWSLHADKNCSSYLYPGDNGNALCLENKNAYGRAFAVQKLVPDQKECCPLVLRGWSLVLACNPGTNQTKIYYSIELDRIVCSDGSGDGNHFYISFDSGMVGWQFESRVLHFPKPVKSADLLCRWNNMKGRVLFDTINVGYSPYIDETCSMSSGLVRIPLKNLSPSDAYDLRIVVKTSGKGREAILARSETLTLLPDGSIDIELPYSMSDAMPSCTVFVDLLDASTSELYFRRKLPWRGKENDHK